MSGAHLHLLVNHVPIIAACFALALIVASYFWAPDVLRRTAFVVLVATALAAAAADLTGDAASDAVRGLPGIKREIIHDHEEMAEKSFIVAEIAGVIALVTLIRARRRPLSRAETTVGLISAVVVSGMMAYTGLLGGRVRHTEVRPGATARDAAAIEPPPPPR